MFFMANTTLTAALWRFNSFTVNTQHTAADLICLDLPKICLRNCKPNKDQIPL